VIVTRGIAIRLGLLMVFGALFQVTFLSKLIVFDVAPDMLPALAIVLGLLGGAVVGASAGFALGLIADSVLIAPLGITSLALLSAGYLAGRFREAFDIANTLVPIALAGILTAVSATIITVVQLTLGVESDVSVLILREIFLQGLMATALMAVVFPLVRRVLRPALIDLEPRRRPMVIGSGGRRATVS
jgi:rod shape-determining protein MreD